METENTLEIKHEIIFHTNGEKLRQMLDELESLLKKINDFTLEVYGCNLPAQELIR